MDSFYTEKPSGLDQSRNDPTLISRSMRSMNHHELADRGVGCISPAAELDGKLRNPRRRVPVACNRCRRRKIKCSGDTGDGQGCTNCRSAGAGHCQFLRVNSKECHSLNWPYSGTESTTIVPSSWRGVSLRGKSSVPPMGSNQGCMDAFQRSPSYDLVGADTQVYPRSMGLDSIHYDDEQSAGFAHSSAYGHPATPSGVLPDYGASAWSPKAWNSMFNGNRATNGGIYPDPEASGAISQSPYTYMLPGQGLPSADLSQATNTAMATVSSPEVLSSDRTLPTPTSRSHHLSGSANGMGLLPTEGLHGLPLLSDFKGPFWNTRCGTSPDQRATPTHIVPSNAPFGTSSPPEFKCPSTNTNAPELMFTYPPPPTTTDDISPPLSSTATVPSTTGCGNPPYPILDTLGTPSSEYGKIASDTRLRGSFSRDHSSNGQRLMALANECTPEIYGYTSSEKSKARVTDGSDMHSSAATLMNGLPYTRVRHQDPPNAAFPFNLLPDTLPEYHRAAVENVHRPPVSPLGNQGAY